MIVAPEQMVVTIADIRVEKLCLRGARNWFDLHPPFTWQGFMAGQYTVEELEQTGDPLALRVCKNARARWEATNGQ